MASKLTDAQLGRVVRGIVAKAESCEVVQIYRYNARIQADESVREYEVSLNGSSLHEGDTLDEAFIAAASAAGVDVGEPDVAVPRGDAKWLLLGHAIACRWNKPCLCEHGRAKDRLRAALEEPDAAADERALAMRAAARQELVEAIERSRLAHQELENVEQENDRLEAEVARLREALDRLVTDARAYVTEGTQRGLREKLPVVAASISYADKVLASPPADAAGLVAVPKELVMEAVGVVDAATWAGHPEENAALRALLPKLRAALGEP